MLRPPFSSLVSCSCQMEKFQKTTFSSFSNILEFMKRRRTWEEEMTRAMISSTFSRKNAAELRLTKMLLHLRTFSGIQSGILHLLNYLGAVKRWVEHRKLNRSGRIVSTWCSAWWTSMPSSCSWTLWFSDSHQHEDCRGKCLINEANWGKKDLYKDWQ